MAKNVTIIGLGYVGLPLLLLAAEKGYNVTGYDIDKKKIETLQKGLVPIKSDEWISDLLVKLKERLTFTTDGAKAISKADIVVICVPTPIDKKRHPNLKPLINAVEVISENIKKGQLIIVESTVYPGTCDEIVKPILEKRGLRAGKDFYLAHCPERIDPGNKKYTVRNIPRVIGAVSKEGLKKAMNFYKTLIEAELYPMDEIKEAEAVKVVENSFRDINIAFVNELAQAFDGLGINLINVIKGAATKPFGFLPHWPGIGVGGHCIPVDPYYLIEKSTEAGFKLTFLRMARQINEDMPNYAIHKIMLALNELGIAVKNSKITILGVAYKGNIDDIRNSPALTVIEKLKKLGANIRIYDPYLPEMSTHLDLEGAIDNADCVFIATDHKEFKIDASLLKRKNVRSVVDGKNILNRDEIIAQGIVYQGIGQGDGVFLSKD